MPNRKAAALKTGLIAALGVALAGSVWATDAVVGCDTCGEAKGLIGGADLGWLGVAFYVALLVAFALPRTRWAALWGVQAAGAAHLVMVGMLLANGVICPACLLTAVGAWVALGLSFAVEPKLLERVWIVMPAVAGMTLVGMLALQARARAERQRHVRRAAESILHEHRDIASGRAVLLVFTRAKCKHCNTLKDEVVPPIVHSFGESLNVEERPAWQGLPSPTVVVVGADDTLVVFPGLPDLERLREAVSEAVKATGRRPAWLDAARE